MSDVAIETSELGKRYTLGLQRRGYGTLRESIVEAAKRPLGRLRRAPDETRPATRSGRSATSR